MRHPETTRGSLIFEMQPLPEISGFYPWGRITSVTDPSRPDTYYALSKVYVEGLGSMYADRYGLEVHQPPHRRFLAGAPEPAQLAEPRETRCDSSPPPSLRLPSMSSPATACREHEAVLHRRRLGRTRL